ncbi:MAG: tRNA glutamyl-Q(34) synthetase GluQRS [Proteobacteria bacterium]|nr:tRNA glutamyl-Q(34) synthetase GluQRS [Pseudomonadota bacterium]
MTAPAAHGRRCGRFAPSPTGPLHFGSLVAAVASHADARARHAQWRVRIEDVDVPRTVAGAEEDIVATLARHGMVADGSIVRQSARTAHYERAVAALAARGATYECACTRAELALASAVDPASGERVYPGTCRDGVPAGHAARTARATRVRVGTATIAFEDRVQGHVEQALATDAGDFVVRRSDGLYAYQLAVVVDDGAERVTDIVRGADLIASTPRQIHLQRLLGLPEPTYLHVPVAITASGEKLSKQTGASALGRDALASLAAAWAFLGQPALPAADSVDAFWAVAPGAWDPTRIPRTYAAPAPRGLA